MTISATEGQLVRATRTPHRVRNVSGRERLSFPLSSIPAFAAVIVPLPAHGAHARDDSNERWDRANVHAFDGTYGDYLLGKVGKVFPDLGRTVLSGIASIPRLA